MTGFEGSTADACRKLAETVPERGGKSMGKGQKRKMMTYNKVPQDPILPTATPDTFGGFPPFKTQHSQLIVMAKNTIVFVG